MSNIQVFNAASSNVPAFVKARGVTAVAKALAGGSMQTGKRISIEGGVFRLIHDGKQVASIEERFLDVVIVNAAPFINRTYYAGVYDKNNPAPPTCWSVDGKTPHPDVKQPQGPNCVNCPQNQKGSGQGDTKACRYSQRVAVLLANDISEESDVLQMQLPSQSIFGKAEGENMPLQEFSRRLVAQGVDPTMVVTRMKFDTNSSSPKLFFKPMRWLSDEEFAICSEKGQSEDAIKAIEFTVAQTDGVTGSVAAPAPLGGTPPKAAKPAPAPAAAAQEEDDEPPPPPPKATKPRAAKAEPAPVAQAAEEDDAPPVVRAKPAPTPAAPGAVDKSALQSTLDSWDD